jgi:hypothetical protein
MKKDSDAPDMLTAEERERVKAWCKARFPRKLKDLGDLWEECRDWHLSNGKKRNNWEATFRNWVRNAVRFRYHQGSSEVNKYQTTAHIIEWSDPPQSKGRPSHTRERHPLNEVIPQLMEKRGRWAMVRVDTEQATAHSCGGRWREWAQKYKLNLEITVRRLPSRPSLVPRHRYGIFVRVPPRRLKR